MRRERELEVEAGIRRLEDTAGQEAQRSRSQTVVPEWRA
jgi:hypothetical protein